MMELKNKSDMLVSEPRQFFFSQVADIGTVNSDCTFSGFQQGSHDLKEGGFTGSAGTNNGNNFAFSDGNTYSL